MTWAFGEWVLSVATEWLLCLKETSLFSRDFIFTENTSLRQKKTKEKLGDSFEASSTHPITGLHLRQDNLHPNRIVPFQSYLLSPKRCDEIYNVESELIPIPTSESVPISRIPSSPLRHSSSRPPISISLFFQGTI